ncbi:uncharacterized protein PAM68-like [Salvia hispanica]|uniref:uncharacterized protein PAM68-like n=1 Tax=Salvia hispanica TaxID=49212 RepID=UPI002009A0CA|nr:uncharacterized protein PAM68-like [Salvia hispanica]
MRTLTILQQIAPSHITRPSPWPQIHRLLLTNRPETPFPSPRKWQLQSGAKGFTSRPNGGQSVARKGENSGSGGGDDDDDKISDEVWERMIKRILSSVGVPLAIGFALLKGFDVAIENGSWNVPKWLPFVTTFLTFGASALGIAYGSLSTSLNEAEEGSLLGFEQLQKNWVEMWKEEDAASS